MTISKGEYYFFNKIKDDCNIIFDVGCREDSPYIEICPDRSFHLFEPNPFSYNKIVNSLSEYLDKNKNIFINNFGLGKKTTDLEYYPESESFMPRPKHFRVSKPVILHIKRFSEYISENNIGKIDFLKIDTEGWEPDIIFDDVSFIENNIKYIQFEYASTWLDREEILTLSSVYNIFNNVFDFYFLFDEKHPITNMYKKEMSPINRNTIDLIEDYMNNDYGFNIAMIRKTI